MAKFYSGNGKVEKFEALKVALNSSSDSDDSDDLERDGDPLDMEELGELLCPA